MDEDGRYAGMVIVPEAHAADLAAIASVRDILRHADNMLLPQMTAQEAIAAFDRTRRKRCRGRHAERRRRSASSEAHALRRYSDASERQRRELWANLAASIRARERPIQC